MDEATLHHILGSHGASLWRIARCYGAPTGSEEDLHQEILLQLWRALPTFRGDSAPSTWAYRVALNTALQWRRAADRRDGGQIHRPPPPVAGAARSMEAILAEFLAELSPVDRSILLLYMDGLSHAEIGAITGLSPGAVAVRVHRIRQGYTRRYLEE